MRKNIRVYLRALEVNDHLKIHQWRNQEDIRQNFSSIPLFTSTINEQNWVEARITDKNSVSCAICIKETDEFIGCIFLNEIDYHNRIGHIPVFIGEMKYRGQGFATDARILMLKYAFFDRGLERIWAKVIEGNAAAVRMLEKSGFQKEGLLRKSCFRNGHFVNEIYLGVLKEDFIKVLEEYEL